MKTLEQYAGAPYTVQGPITDSFPIYIFQVKEDLPVYEAWIGYTYLGIANLYQQTYSTAVSPTGKSHNVIVDLHFDWGTLSVDQKYLRVLKSLGKFRQQQNKDITKFIMVHCENYWYLLAGQHVLFTYDGNAQRGIGYRHITVNSNFLTRVGQ